MNKNRVFFYHIKKYHFSSSNQKYIFFVKTSSCINYFAKKFLEKNVSYDGLNMSVILRQVNFLNFVEILKEKWSILKEKWSIFSDWNSGCNSECQNLINEGNFWQKLFCKIINATRGFHKKYFFDTNWRNDIFWYGEKIHDFCFKIHNSKYLQNTKKIFAP